METAPSGGAGMGCYADSLDSMSPRSRGGESWEEPLASSAAAQAAAAAAGGNASSKLRLMCSYGGHIVPRPHDKTLCYLGGETRIVVVDRHSTLADLQAHLSRTLLAGCPFSLKYQLPSEDLDSLISVTTDEDLDNMVEEYDRIAGGSTSSSTSSSATSRKPSRLRLFLFVAKPESAGPSSSISSLLDDSKSETWFVDALNGAMLNRNLSSADSAASSVNCLLGLDDLNPSSNGTGTGNGVLPDHHTEMLFPRQDSSIKVAAVAAVGGRRHGGQDVHSVPESPKASSFGSASSTPSLSNLPPIRVRPEDRGPDLRMMGAGLDDQFAHMTVSGEQKHLQHQLDAADATSHQQFYPAPPHLNVPVNTAVAAAGAPNPANYSPTENPNPSRVFSDDDRSDSGDLRRSPPQQPKEQQQNTNLMDTPISSDAVSRPVYYQERPFSAVDPTKQEGSAGDPSYRLPVHITEQGYLLQQPPPPPQPSMQTVEQLQQHQAQQHFIQANQHLLHHHPSAAGAAGAAIPLASYYQIPIHSQQQLPKPAHSYNTQVPMYFLPVRQNPPYGIAQQSFAEGATAAPISSATGKPTIPMPSTVLPRVVPTKPELAPPSAHLYRTGANAAAAPAAVQPPQPTHLIHLADQSPQYVSYHPMHHHPSQSTAAVPGYSYEYADAVHGQPMYYTAATSAALPTQFQAMNPVAVSADSAPAMQHPTGDLKQTRAL